MFKKILRRIRKPSGTDKTTDADFVLYENVRLPTRRSNQGLGSNELYVSETTTQISKFLNADSSDVKILDFGCGQGRLLNGLILSKINFLEYVGIDIDSNSVSWCIRNLTYSENISFIWYNSRNDRYNRQGIDNPGIPTKDNNFSHIFSNSVFSHLNQGDVRKYADLLRSSAVIDAKLYLTAFTEEDVLDCAENPDGYMGGNNDKPALLRVRYNKAFFIGLFEKCGWELQSYEQNGIQRTGQSELTFRAK